MAIALRATNGAKTGASGTLAVPVPTGTVSGDVLVIGIIVSGTTVPATPSGLTLLTSANAGPAVAIYYRVCDGTEGASFSFTVASGSTATSRSYSGCSGTPINVNGTPNRTASSTTCTASSITTTVNGCELLWFGFSATNAGATSPAPTGFANSQYQHQTSGTTTSAASLDEAQTTAGATGSVAGTFGVSANNYGVLVALAPSSGAIANTVTASPGSMAITGDAITPPVAHKPTASSGSMAITGSAVTPPVAHKPTASPGSIAITGSSTTLPVAHRPNLSPGSMTITGDAALLPIHHAPSALPGVIVINGDAATLQGPTGTAFTLSVSPGSYAITGSSTTPKVGRALVSSPGVYTISGSNATLVGPGPPPVTVSPDVPFIPLAIITHSI